MYNLRGKRAIRTANIPSDSEDTEDDNGDALFDSDTDSDGSGSDSDSNRPIVTQNCRPNDGIIWSEHLERFAFPKFCQRESGAHHELDIANGEVDFLKLFLDDELISWIVSQTNLFATQKMCERDEAENRDATIIGSYNAAVEFDSTDSVEIQCFIGMLIFMGIKTLPAYTDYWSDDPKIRVPFIANLMTLRRFQLLLRFLHVNDNTLQPGRNEQHRDKLFKVRPYLNLLLARFSKKFIPYQPISIDETMIAFKGRSSLKQFMPLKPVKRGFKCWTLACPRTGYTYCFEPYTGKIDGHITRRPGFGPIQQTVLDLAMMLPPTNGYIVHADRFFSTPALVKSLLDEGIFYCGTVKGKNPPIGFPRDLIIESKKRGRLQQGDYIGRQSDRIVALAWKDKKPVYFLSSAYPATGDRPLTVNRKQQDGTKKAVACPVPALLYGKGMGGVDLADQLVGNYGFGIPTHKWWPRYFFHYTNVAIVNAFILYKMAHGDAHASMYTTNDKDAHKRFRLVLVDILTANYMSRKRKRGPDPTLLPPNRKQRRHDRVKLRGRIQQCQQCMVESDQLRIEGKHDQIKRPRESYFGCAVCGVHLCKAHFEKYHGQ